MTTIKIPVVRWALGDNEAADSGGYARPLYYQPRATKDTPNPPRVRVGTITDRAWIEALMSKLS